MDSSFLTSFLQQENNVDAAFLFGSYGRGDTHTESDVDVGVLYKTHAQDMLIAQVRSDALRHKLEEQFHLEFDVIDVEYAPSPLQYAIIQGKTLVADNLTKVHRLENAILNKMELDYRELS